MNIYSQKQIWKLALSLLAILIGVASLFITGRLVKELKEEERKKIELWAQATKQLVSSSSQGDFSLAITVISENTNIPVILVDECDSILETRNMKFFSSADSLILSKHSTIKHEPYSLKKDSLIVKQGEKLIYSYKKFLRKNLREIRKGGDEPIEINFVGDKQWIYYKDSELLNNLRYYPIYQLLFITVFVFVGYMVFSSARKSEQNQVWAGMAKETAHQIATPLSSLMAWIELIKHNDNNDMVFEMQKDLKRLETIADRFSKIGSKPKLESHNIVLIVEKSIKYLKSRLSQNTEFILNNKNEQLFASVNKTLLEWVIENICKNAVDAMQGKGKISISVLENISEIQIIIKDTGKGIDKILINDIFKPGVTSKARGWGLGLSLSKRIIEDYHTGKLYIKESNLKDGTSFAISLPKKSQTT
ncbi:MAG: HAMP domain-containing sensor histidine kinase [Flavobacteriales bacterium]|nr:HAMP domain-containing sensor histidine kinase [Flavobacteriales bacterium]